MTRHVRACLVTAVLGIFLLAPGCTPDNETTSGVTGKTDTSAPPTDYTKQSRGNMKPSGTEGAKGYPGKAPTAESK
jgi:hypothetical protein